MAITYIRMLREQLTQTVIPLVIKALKCMKTCNNCNNFNQCSSNGLMN